MSNEKFIKLLSPELQLVFIVLDNSIIYGDGIILSGQKGFEGHHGGWSVCWTSGAIVPIISV